MRAGIVLLGASALLASCGGSHEPQPTQAGNDVAGIPVLLEEIQVYVPVEGTVMARNRAEIATRMMARVTAIDADVGTRVRQGQVLVRLGAEDIAANRAKAEAGVTAAQAAGTRQPGTWPAWTPSWPRTWCPGSRGTRRS
jgi:multidrug efflux pump subunit AcrA (membrane-fusion protein)